MEMLIFIILSLCLQASDAHFWKNQEYKDMRRLRRLTAKLLDADREVCATSDSQIHEVFGADRYRLTMTMEGVNVADVAVATSYRVLQVAAKSVRQLRILPAKADTSKGSWVLEDGMLEVQFPWKKSEFCAEEEQDSSVVVPVVQAAPGSIDERTGFTDDEPSANDHFILKN